MSSNMKEKLKPNFIWLTVENVIRLSVGILVSVAVVNYLSPKMFGELAYALAVSGFVTTLGHLGLGGILVRVIHNISESEGARHLRAVVAVRFVWIAILVLLVAIASYLYDDLGVHFELVVLGLTAAVLTSFQTYESWFEARVLSKWKAWASLISFAVGSFLKISAIYNDWGVNAIALATVIQAAVLAFLTLFFYQKLSKQVAVIGQSALSATREMIRSSAPVYFGTICAVIYLKIDQFMLRWMAGSEELAIYAVAAQWSEAIYFMPAVWVSTLYPKLISEKEKSSQIYYRTLQAVIDLLWLLAAITAVIVVLSADYLIGVLYSDTYASSALILKIHIFSAFFVFTRAAVSKWIVLEKLYSYSLISQGFGAFANVVLNFFLIQFYGAEGAAWATVLSYFIASYLAFYFLPKGAEIFKVLSLAPLGMTRYKEIRGLFL